MKLSKLQALELVKILSQYTMLVKNTDLDVNGLCRELEDFLTGEEDEDEEDNSEDEDLAEEEDAEELDEQEDEQSAEADEESEGFDGECGESADESLCDAGDLNLLSTASGKVISLGTVEKNSEYEQTGHLLFVINGTDRGHCRIRLVVGSLGLITNNVLFVKRTANELHVCEDMPAGEKKRWWRLHVAKFPKDWTFTLPLNVKLKVV